MLKSAIKQLQNSFSPSSNLLTKEQDVERKMLQYKGMAKEITEYCGSLENKSILEVGSGWREECLSKYLNDNYPLKKIVAIDPVAKAVKKVDATFEIKQDDIRNTSFADNEFDIITSIAAFEHVPDFEQSLAEMFRILKPGGVLYTKFGPIWSGPWGHHLWVQHDNTLYSYNNTHLPSYCHFLMTEDELINHCQHEMNIPFEAAQKIANFIYHSSDQNRLFYSDYETFFNRSPFDVLFFYGSNMFPLQDGYKTNNYKELMLDLVTKHPDKQGWTYNTIFCMLHKPQA